jgi:hypothetical protein
MLGSHVPLALPYATALVMVLVPAAAASPASQTAGTSKFATSDTTIGIAIYNNAATQTVPRGRTPISQEVQAIKATIQRHWQAINLGDYVLAFSYLSPNYRSKFPDWVRDKNKDQPRSSPIRFGPVKISGSTAQAAVSFRTVGHETGPGNTGCNAWSGSYSMVKKSGRWYISRAKLQRTSLSCSG